MHQKKVLSFFFITLLFVFFVFWRPSVEAPLKNDNVYQEEVENQVRETEKARELLAKPGRPSRREELRYIRAMRRLAAEGDKIVIDRAMELVAEDSLALGLHIPRVIEPWYEEDIRVEKVFDDLFSRSNFDQVRISVLNVLSLNVSNERWLHYRKLKKILTAKLDPLLEVEVVAQSLAILRFHELMSPEDKSSIENKFLKNLENMETQNRWRFFYENREYREWLAGAAQHLSIERRHPEIWSSIQGN